jgi:glucose-6-phosphate 1-epimerase
MAVSIKTLRTFEIAGRVHFAPGQNGLPKVRLASPWSEAEVYLHGAQVTGFQAINQEPLLFLSRASRFAPGKAIRGGIPLCFPWFGPRADDVAHGFARLTDWEVTATEASEEHGTTIRFQLPPTSAALSWPAWRVELSVRINQRLELELAVSASAAQSITY